MPGVRQVDEEIEVFVHQSELNSTVIILIDVDGMQTRYSLNELINTFELRS